MPRLTQQEIRNNAISFVHEWKGESRERAENTQSLWRSTKKKKHGNRRKTKNSHRINILI